MADRLDKDPFSGWDSSDIKIEKVQNKSEVYQQIPLLADVTKILSKKKIVRTEIEEKKEKYIITTRVVRNNRRWLYSTEAVPSNDIPETIIDRDMLDWQMFIEKAGKHHSAICNAIAKEIEAQSKKKKRKVVKLLRIILAFVIAASILLAIVYIPSIFTPSNPPRPTTDEIVESLENGQFKKVKEWMQTLPDNAETAELRLKNKLNSSLNVDLLFETWKENEFIPKSYSVNDLKIRDIVLSDKDRYRLFVKTPKGSGQLYLYIFQQDQKGLEMLMPNSKWWNTDNPVRYNSEYQMPPKNVFKWMQPDKLTDGNGPVDEFIYIIVSPWKAKDIERYYDQNNADGILKAMSQRKDLNIKSIFYEKFSFKHDKRDIPSISDIISKP
ncbi:hypothetical protein DENIS_4049 [Desulfonema ishimotonii]|uniref:DUF4384 domain-containing protein n=1 Tax=Desulfonema ishimotonii TaxID=45657 RepID=A0A401G1G3_9BACT|nr:hypothetical protein [Desulfonema ishimotonii]GBC63060.1 hypothetical protein DENIS_4049 [Desulfonema ishimotonii]